MKYCGGLVEVVGQRLEIARHDAGVRGRDIVMVVAVVVAVVVAARPEAKERDPRDTFLVARAPDAEEGERGRSD